MSKLSVQLTERRPAGERERERRAEALRRQRADERVQKLAGAGELGSIPVLDDVRQRLSL